MSSEYKTITRTERIEEILALTRAEGRPSLAVVEELARYAMRAEGLVEALKFIAESKPGGQHNDGLGHIAMIDIVILPTAKAAIADFEAEG